MAQNQPDRLFRLAGRLTRYEVVAIASDGRVYGLGYWNKSARSQRGLRGAISSHGLELIRATGEEHYHFSQGVAYIGGWTIKHSGRTERDAIESGELPRLRLANA